MTSGTGYGRETGQIKGLGGVPWDEFWIEEARLVQAGLVEGGEVVLREALPAVWAVELPGLGEGIDLPGVHVHRPPAGRAVAVGPDHP